MNAAASQKAAVDILATIIVLMTPFLAKLGRRILRTLGCQYGDTWLH